MARESARTTQVGRKEPSINVSMRPRPLLRLFALALLSVGILTAPGGAQATASGTVVAWGCGGTDDFGQCSAPTGRLRPRPSCNSGTSASSQCRITEPKPRPLRLSKRGSPDAPRCGRRGVCHRLLSFLRFFRHESGCGDWFEDLPPDSGVREPGRPPPGVPSSGIALALPPDLL